MGQTALALSRTAEGRLPRLLGVLVRAVPDRHAAARAAAPEFPSDQFQVIAVNLDENRRRRRVSRAPPGDPSVSDPQQPAEVVRLKTMPPLT
jgi:hypothetical protein